MLPTRRGLLLRGAAVSAFFTASAFLLTAALRLSASFASGVYLPFSRAVSGLLGKLFSLSRYAAAEGLLVTAAVLSVFCLSRAIFRSVRERAGWSLLIWLSNAAVCVSGAFFLFILLWGGAYYAPKLESRLSLQPAPADEELLYRTALRHLEDVLHYSRLVPRDASGAVSAGGFDAIAPQAAQAVKALSGRYPSLTGKAAVTPPKRVVSNSLFGMLGISGIYVPFTGEAVVSTVGTDPFLPSTMCHELAHRLGFAPEEDANLIAYLACMESEEPIFRYSGALMAYTYCYNALPDSRYKWSLWSLMREGSEDVSEDFSRNRKEWDRYDGPLRETAQAVNDAYLQTMGQEEGVRSYGRVVDMLIALYLSERGSE